MEKKYVVTHMSTEDCFTMTSTYGPFNTKQGAEMFRTLYVPNSKCSVSFVQELISPERVSAPKVRVEK